MNRAFVIVIDSFGIGGADDAALYGDEGSNTYKSISSGIHIPNLVTLGLNNIDGVDVYPKAPKPLGDYARLKPKSAGKDTTTGHFELAGIVNTKPQPTFPSGFPKHIIDKLTERFGMEIIGNVAASGTEIINRLGDEATEGNKAIVYTSADSVLQIAVNEEKVGLKKLYEMCRAAREIMSGDYAVGRIIARPFLKGENGYYRTPNRKDFSLLPPSPTMLDKLSQKGYSVIGIGKINDIFSGKGLTRHIEAHGNDEVICETEKVLDESFKGICFVNLVDTDMVYGHRNDIKGYRECVERIDKAVGRFLPKVKQGDLFIITADHGCDPATPSTDHSREDVPYLAFTPSKTGRNLGTIYGFDFVSRIVLEHFGIQ